MDQRHTTVVHAVRCHYVTLTALTTDDSQLLAEEQASCVSVKVRIADLQTANRILHPSADHLVRILLRVGCADF